MHEHHRLPPFPLAESKWYLPGKNTPVLLHNQDGVTRRWWHKWDVLPNLVGVEMVGVPLIDGDAA